MALISADMGLTPERIAELEKPVTDEQFRWLEEHGRLDNGLTYAENVAEVEAEERIRAGNTPSTEEEDEDDPFLASLPF